MKSDLGNIATGTAFAFAGSILGNSFSYLFGFMIGRLLGAESLGLYFLALVIVQAVSSVCRLGLPEGLLRFVAIHSGTGDLPRAKGTIFSAVAISGILSTLLGLILFISAVPISERIFKQPNLDLCLRWFAVGLPFFTVFIIMVNSIQALKRIFLAGVPGFFAFLCDFHVGCARCCCIFPSRHVPSAIREDITEI
jgi:O-antigen/teichoic acid export membrane protein